MTIKYIITTTPRYSQPLNHLLDSMYVCGIESSDIFLSCQNTFNGIESYSYKSYNDIHKVNIAQNIYEYSFFITCNELLNARVVAPDDYFFLIHDTSILLIDHKEKIQKISQLLNQYDIIMGDQIGRYNIGLYNSKSINIGYNLWYDIEYISKQQAIDIEHNRPHSINNKKNLSIKNNSLLKVYFPNLISRLYYNIEVYDSKKLRVTGTLDFFSIYKYFFEVKNHTQHPNMP